MSQFFATFSTAGHVDHGKTTLIRALTGIECDTHPEEKRRGITISNGYASLKVDDVQIGFVDVPGHHRYIKQMVAGASAIDFFLLVISADDGVMVQTKEHLKILKLFGIKRGIVAVTKVDTVDDELKELVELEIIEELESHFEQTIPVHFVSGVTGEGIDNLKEDIIKLVKTKEGRSETSFKMFIDRSFSVKGLGTVVTGSSLGGKLVIGDKLYSKERELIVKSIQLHGESISELTGRKRVALQLSTVSVDEIPRGSFVSIKTVNCRSLIDCQLSLDEPLKLFKKSRVAKALFYVGTVEVSCKLRALDEQVQFDTKEVFVQIELEREIPIFLGDRFILRNSSNDVTLGGGTVLDITPLVHKKQSVELISSLAARVSRDSELMIKGEIIKYQRPIKISNFEEALGISQKEIESSSECTVVDGLVFGNRVIKECSDRIIEMVKKHNTINFCLEEGVKISSITKRLFEGSDGYSSVVKRLVSLLMEEQLRESKISGVSLKTFRPTITKEQERVLKNITSLEKSEIKTFEQTELEKKLGLQNGKLLLLYMLENEICLKIGDSYIISSDLLRAKRLLENSVEITVSSCRDLFNSNRKSTISILEYFDSIGLTRRDGDVRILES